MNKLTFAIALLLCVVGQIAAFAGGLLSVDYQNLIARADLTYQQSIGRSEGGIPIGNGRMGSLLWTAPAALKMQINRVDVFANGNASNSFPERHTDYCGGCGFVDLDFSVSAEEVFRNDGTTARLFCYEGLARVEGRGVVVEALACGDPEVIALRIEDRREKPDAIGINLRMLRPATLRTAQPLGCVEVGSPQSADCPYTEFYGRQLLLRFGSHYWLDRPRSAHTADQQRRTTSDCAGRQWRIHCSDCQFGRLRQKCRPGSRCPAASRCGSQKKLRRTA